MLEHIKQVRGLKMTHKCKSLAAHRVHGATCPGWTHTLIHLCKRARARASTPAEAEHAVRCGLCVEGLQRLLAEGAQTRSPPLDSSSAPSTQTPRLIIDEPVLVFTQLCSPGALPELLPLSVITVWRITIRAEDGVKFSLMKNMH